MNHRPLTLVLALAMLLSGCQSLQTVDPAPARLGASLTTGDRVMVYERSGRVLDLTLTGLDGDSLEGTLPDGYGTVQVSLDEIERLEVERIDGVRTTLAVAGTALIIVPLVLLGALAGGMGELEF